MPHFLENAIRSTSAESTEKITTELEKLKDELLKEQRRTRNLQLVTIFIVIVSIAINILLVLNC